MRNKKDASVQLLRIIACIIVVLVHNRPMSYTSLGYSYGRVLFSCFVADGVAVFLIITGFFYLKSNSYVKVMKKGAVKVALPATILMFFCVLLSGWLEGSMTIVESIEHFSITDLLNIIRAWLTGNANFVTNCGHLWYVFMHMFVLMWFPLLKRFESNEKRIMYEKYALMIIGFIYVILDTWSHRNVWFDMGNLGQYKVIPVAVLFVLIGDEIYRNIDKIKGNWILRIVTAIIFVAFNIIRAFDQLYEYETTGLDTVDGWDSLYGVICSTSLALFIISIRVREDGLGKGIMYFAKFTFPIYLFHYVIICTFINHSDSIKHKIDEYFGAQEGTIMQYLSSVIVNAVIVFVIALAMSILVHYIIIMCKKLWNKVGMRNND